MWENLYNTLIKDTRWKWYLEGISETVIISIGAIGIGTVLVMVLQASIFQFACKITRYEPRNAQHEDFLDTYHRLTGK